MPHASCQRTTGISIASGATASSSAPPNSSTGPTLLKTKATAGRGTKPSPHKKQVAFQVPSDEDEADDEELAEIIRNRQQRAARAKGSDVPLMLDPKKILDFIDLWHKDPNTPLPEMNLTPGQSHMLAAFIGEEKWKFEKARRAKKAQYKKERFLKKNVVTMTTDELLKIQSEIKALSDEFDAYRADWLGAKVRFVKLAKGFSPNVAASSHIEIPQAEASAQPTEEHASTADEIPAA